MKCIRLHLEKSLQHFKSPLKNEPQVGATTKAPEGQESHFGPHLYVDGLLGGEEKAGFGAQPQDFVTILRCPGDISNNIKGFGASNFKMLLRRPIPQWHLASQGPFFEG